jgi:hypothetical protein
MFTKGMKSKLSPIPFIHRGFMPNTRNNGFNPKQVQVPESVESEKHGTSFRKIFSEGCKKARICLFWREFRGVGTVKPDKINVPNLFRVLF